MEKKTSVLNPVFTINQAVDKYSHYLSTKQRMAVRQHVLTKSHTELALTPQYNP